MSTISQLPATPKLRILCTPQNAKIAKFSLQLMFSVWIVLYASQTSRKRDEVRLHLIRVLLVHFINLLLSHPYNPPAPWLLTLHMPPLSTFLLSHNPTHESATMAGSPTSGIYGYLWNSQSFFQPSTPFFAPFPTLFLIHHQHIYPLSAPRLHTPHTPFYSTSHLHPTLTSTSQSYYLAFCSVPILTRLCTRSALLPILFLFFGLHCSVLHTIQCSHDTWRSRHTLVALCHSRNRVLQILFLFSSLFYYPITRFLNSVIHTRSIYIQYDLRFWFCFQTHVLYQNLCVWYPFQARFTPTCATLLFPISCSLTIPYSMLYFEIFLE